MPYRYLDDIAIADVAFEAWGITLEEMMLAASDATINVMIANPDSIGAVESRKFELKDSQLDLLLFQLLQELIFYKDAENLLLRVRALQLLAVPGEFAAVAEAQGERIDPAKHDLLVDVKAVTLHRLKVEAIFRGWRATVVLDV